MLIKQQGNIGDSINVPIQKSLNDIIFTNSGGKSNMSLYYKNIPPMEHNDIPAEIQIKDSEDVAYTKIKSYNKNCQLNNLCTDEIPMFRFQVIYDGYDFLYYPEFKLYERPSLLLDSNLTAGTNIINFSKNGGNLEKDLLYLEIGQSILFKDYNREYIINNVVELSNLYTVYLTTDIVEDYLKNDLIIFNNVKYEIKENSNILNDSSVNNFSPFKFKFIDTFNSKNYVISDSIGKTSDYILVNNVYNQFVDLQGDDKFVSLSNNIDISHSDTIGLNSNVSVTDTIIELTSEPLIPLDIYSYLTIESSNGLEIVKIINKNSNVNYTVNRAQLGTFALEHSSSSALLYFPKNVYFIMLPYNKSLDKRYVLYRNLSFILSQV